jgi:hypothetical protein
VSRHYKYNVASLKTVFTADFTSDVSNKTIRISFPKKGLSEEHPERAHTEQEIKRAAKKIKKLLDKQFP